MISLAMNVIKAAKLRPTAPFMILATLAFPVQPNYLG